MAGYIGKYQLLEEIGRGGFGIVYRAFDPTVNRTVAIKVLTVSGDQELLSRFRNEAAAAGNLHHPNIVTVHEFGESDEGMPFMVMQFLEGETLQSIIHNQRPLTLIQKMSIMWQVAEGLNHAHEHGVVHRDVKPPNIMILPDESVQMMDFGIARMTASTKHQTRTGFVVGTPLYMAPEQFLPGTTVDHRADIWAYGVIYYELLSGRNPFAAQEDATILYQIAHVEPPMLRTLAPHVPAALEDMVHRLLAKDPDFRYTSLRDFQFDVQPILVDLSRERAAEMLLDARQLAQEDRLEEAQTTAQKVLRLDPSNRDAHTLLGSVKQRLQRRQLQPKIDSFIAKAEQEQGKRNHAGAVEALEAASRLSPTDQSIRERLEQARSLREQSRRCERLLADAERELRAQNLTSALRIASEAVQVDPGNTTAGMMLSTIQQEIEAREAKRKVEEVISKARGLMLLQQYDDAISLLSGLADSVANNEVVAELLANANREKSEQERRQRRAKEIGHAREALRARRFDEAVQRLEALASDFAGDVEVEQLLRYAREEHAYQKRTETVRQIVKDAETLQADQQYDNALELIERSLGQFPGEPLLVRLVQTVTVARAAWQRRLAVDRCMAEAAQLRQNGQFEQALQRVNATLAEFNDEQPLLQLKTELQREWKAAQRAAALQRAVEQAQSYLKASNPAQAIAVLEPAAKEHSGDPTVTALLADARRAKEEQEKQRFIDNALKNAAEREQRKDVRGALSTIEKALSQQPGAPALTSAAERLREAAAAAERQENIARLISTIESAIRAGDFRRALQTVEIAHRDFPAEQRFEQLGEKARQGQRAADLKSFVSRIRETHRTGQQEECQRLLKDAAAQFPGEAAIVDLQRQISSEMVHQSMAAAEEHLRHQRFDEAQAAAQTALRWNPDDAVATVLLRRVERERDLAAVDSRVNEMCAIPDYERAAKALKVARQRYPDEPRLAAREQEILSILETDRSRREFESALNQARQALESGDLQEAEGRARQALTSRPDDATAQALMNAAKVQLEIAASLDQVAALMQSGNLSGAKDALTSTLARFPADPRLQSKLEEVRAKLYADAVDQAHKHLDAGRLDEAADAAQTALNYRPRDPSASALLNQSRQRKLLIERMASIRRLAQEHGAAAALESLAAARQDYGHVPELDALDREIREQAYSESVGKAREELDHQRLEEARSAAQKALAARPNDAAATSLLRVINLENEISLGVEAVHKALETNDLAQARSLVGNALRMYPGEARFAALQGQVEQKVRTATAKERAEVSRLIDERQFERALVLVKDLEGLWGAMPELDADKKRATAEWDKQKKLDSMFDAEFRRVQEYRRSGDPDKVKAGCARLLELRPGEAQALQLLQWANAELEARAIRATAAQPTEVMPPPVTAQTPKKKMQAQAAVQTPMPAPPPPLKPPPPVQEARAAAPPAKTPKVPVTPPPVVVTKDPGEKQKSKNVMYGAIAAGVVLVLIVVGVMASRNKETPPSVLDQATQTAQQTPAPQAQSPQQSTTQTAPPSGPPTDAAKPPVAQTKTRPADPPKDPDPEPETPVTPTPAPPANRVGDNYTPQVHQVTPQAQQPASTYPTQTQPTPSQTTVVDRPWLGRKTGKISWSGGVLAANGKLVISTTRVLEGGGEVDADGMPPFTRVNIRVSSPRDRVSVTVAGPNAVVITNTGGAPVRFIELSWEVKP